MSQFGLPTQPSSASEDDCPLATSHQEDLPADQPSSPPGRSDRTLIFGSVILLLTALLVLVGTAFLVNKNKIDDYEHRVDAAERELHSVLTAKIEEKRSFNQAGLRDLYSRFGIASTEVTRTGNEIDNAPSQDGIFLFPAYRTAMSECRAAAAAYNNAARRYPPDYFTGSDLPPMIDIGDDATNCMDDAGED